MSMAIGSPVMGSCMTDTNAPARFRDATALALNDLGVRATVAKPHETVTGSTMVVHVGRDIAMLSRGRGYTNGFPEAIDHAVQEADGSGRIPAVAVSVGHRGDSHTMVVLPIEAFAKLLNHTDAPSAWERAELAAIGRIVVDGLDSDPRWIALMGGNRAHD